MSGVHDGSSPVVGESTEGLGDYLVESDRIASKDQFLRIRRDALAILRQSRPFNGPDGSRTGLVVGYVQSGKTLSMTAVSALAHDNGCRIIVVLAGVTNLLLSQSAKRFRDDLRGSSSRTTWRIFNSADGLGDPAAQRLQAAIGEWKDPTFPKDEHQIFLYVVLKNHTHLGQLRDLLGRADLHGVPSLIIDDEADQAGLNTSPDAPEASRTYQQIAQVRHALPHHTYLQYTATPQAPLLIALDDMLSPAFAELVEPGDGYTGGQAFFGPSSVPALVKAIPSDDLFKPGRPPAEPPLSLLEALRVFFVGAAVCSSRGLKPPRSMLVHPSQRTADHARYMGWILETVKRWATILRDPDDLDRLDVVSELRQAYDELARNDDELPPFDDVVRRVQITLGRVSIKEVNTQDGSEVDWLNADEHILVGGEKLNRGFTVEGLTVTYMPRDAGGWNADTLQQRARFFGYKSKYLKQCRLYLHPDVIEAFRSYVRHEEDIRKQLSAHRGQPLREWRRAFFLSSSMRPTRRNVLSGTYYKVPTKQTWFTQNHPHADLDAARRNKAAVIQLEAGANFHSDDDLYTHQIAELPLRQVYEDLLVTYEVRLGDLPGWYAQLVTLADIVDAEPTISCFLLQMHGEKGRERRRTPEAGGGIKIQQGRGSSGKGYPGDNKLVFDRAVTLQINMVRIAGLAESVVALALHIPRVLRRDDVGVLGER